MSGWPGLGQHPAGALGVVGQKIDGHHGQRLRRRHVPGLRIRDVPVHAVGRASGPGHDRVQDRHDLAQVPRVGGPPAVAKGLVLVLAEEASGAAAEQTGQPRVVGKGQVPRQGLDLHRAPEGHGRAPDGPVDLGGGVLHGRVGARPHVGLQARLRGDDVDDVPALGEDGMDAHAVLVAEGLPLAVDGGEGEVRGVQGIHPTLGRQTGVRGLATEADALGQEAVRRLGQSVGALQGVGASRVDHHRHVDVVEGAQLQQFRLAGQESGSAAAHEVETVVDLHVLLGGNGEEHDPPGQLRGDARRGQAEGGTRETGDLGVVAAGVGRAGGAVGARVAGQDQGVQLAHEGDGRPGPPSFQDRPHSREGETLLEGQARFFEYGFHPVGGAMLLEPDLRLVHHRLPEGDDALTAGLDGGADGVLQLLTVTSHAFLSPSAPAQCVGTTPVGSPRRWERASTIMRTMSCSGRKPSSCIARVRSNS